MNNNNSHITKQETKHTISQENTDVAESQILSPRKTLDIHDFVDTMRLEHALDVKTHKDSESSDSDKSDKSNKSDKGFKNKQFSLKSDYTKSDNSNPDNSNPDNSNPDKSNPDNFEDLTYSEVQINLRLLSDVKEGEKLMITDGRFMQVDNRFVQTARRWLSSDSRARTLRFIDHLIQSAKKYCSDAVDKVQKNEQKQINLEKLINIQSLLKNALTGLGRMVSTYSEDKLNLAIIETYRSTITVFCDQDLKRAIADHKSSS